MYKLAGDPTLELTPQVIHQMMRDNGDLRDEYLGLLGEQDLTPETSVHSTYKDLSFGSSRIERASKQFAVDLKLVKAACSGDIDVVFGP